MGHKHEKAEQYILHFTLTDLDELLLTVRDPVSRKLLGEALTSYRSGAIRAATVSCWIAVVFDILSKLRELSTRGDAAAALVVGKLDRATASDDVQSQQKIESGILGEAKTRFEFLSTSEFENLDRLRRDRNRCAHPAFSPDGRLFSPSPESVRAHIVHAVQHLLSVPPVQGKAALESIKRDLLQPSFPVDQEKATEYLRSKYLNHAKASLIEALVVVCLKSVLRQSEPECIGHEHAVVRCLMAVRDTHPLVYTSQLELWLPRLTDGLDDPSLARVLFITASDSKCWNILDEPTRLRLVAHAQTLDAAADDAGLLVSALSIDELREPALKAIRSADEDSVAKFIAISPRPELSELAVSAFSGAATFRNAEWLGRNVLLPMSSVLSAEQVSKVVAALVDNGQIWFSSDMPEIVCQFYDQAHHHLPQTKSSWQDAMRFFSERASNEDDHYAYPALRARMTEDGIWPAAPRDS